MTGEARLADEIEGRCQRKVAVPQNLSRLWFQAAI